MNPRIIPLNLPAGLEHEIAGNPVSTRLETSAANCFPGLEVDIRNLDRRFFPGLIFEFVHTDAVAFLCGAKLVAIDTSDPEIPNDPDFAKKLQRLQAEIENNAIFLDALTGHDDKRIDLFHDDVPYDWDITWRLVRSLEPGDVTIALAAREGETRRPLMALTAPRRVFWNKSGEFSSAYQPGELTQSLCSPWQHDFRDCGCTYWAANHPDIVLPEHPATAEEFEDAGIDPAVGADPIIWERWDQSSLVSPRPTADGCRPFEMDHYEINQRWRDLPFVFEGRERSIPWSVGPLEEAPPLAERDLIPQLRMLASMEHALALEYLYARYTVRFEDPALPAEDLQSADFIAHELLTIATGEMTHLRWVNQLLWQLNSSDRDHTPALAIARKLPESLSETAAGRGAPRDVQTRPIDLAIADFLAAEAPSGSLEWQYARVLSRLRQGLAPQQTEGAGGAIEYRGRREFSPDQIGLVERIMADGVTHYARFREIKVLLERTRREPLCRRLTNLKEGDPAVRATLPDGNRIQVTYESLEELYLNLLTALRDAYGSGRVEDRSAIIRARQIMLELDAIATDLAKQSVGIPLVDLGRAAVDRLLNSENTTGKR